MGRFDYIDIEDPDPSDSIIENQPVTFDIIEDDTTEGQRS